jgi:hypothetical protein
MLASLSDVNYEGSTEATKQSEITVSETVSERDEK